MPLQKVNFKNLVEYDTSFQRINRGEWIQPIVDKLPESVAVVDEMDKILGFAGIRVCEDEKYTELCPLIAESPEGATSLLKYILEVNPEGYKLKVEIPSENADALRLMEKIGFPINDSNPQLIMFTKYRLQTNMSKVYCILNDVNQFG